MKSERWFIELLDNRITFKIQMSMVLQMKRVLADPLPWVSARKMS